MENISIDGYLENLLERLDTTITENRINISVFSEIAGINKGSLINMRNLIKKTDRIPRKKTLRKLEAALIFFENSYNQKGN